MTRVEKWRIGNGNDDWAARMRKDIVFTMRKDSLKAPVFRAVGDGLKEAMIAKEVLDLLRVQMHDMPLARFEDLYLACCRELMPELWTEETNGKEPRT